MNIVRLSTSYCRRTISESETGFAHNLFMDFCEYIINKSVEEKEVIEATNSEESIRILQNIRKKLVSLVNSKKIDAGGIIDQPCLAAWVSIILRRLKELEYLISCSSGTGCDHVMHIDLSRIDSFEECLLFEGISLEDDEFFQRKETLINLTHDDK